MEQWRGRRTKELLENCRRTKSMVVAKWNCMFEEISHAWSNKYDIGRFIDSKQLEACETNICHRCNEA